MLPGYSPLAYSIEDHIHLGAVPYDGSAPTGFGAHNEPPYLFGHIEKRTPHFNAQADLNRSWTGVPFDHVLRTSDNVSPIVFTDIQYQLRVSQTNLDILAALLKRRVYLVDNRHCPAISDHAPYTRIMLFEDLEYNDNLDPLLNYNIVAVTFRDLSTVAPL